MSLAVPCSLRPVTLQESVAGVDRCLLDSLPGLPLCPGADCLETGHSTPEFLKLLEIPDAADRNVGSELPADRNDTDAAKIFQIERRVDAVGREIRKGKFYCRPGRKGSESLAIGLLWASQI